MSDFINDGRCVTHHHACDCREEYFTKIEEALEEIIITTPIACDSGNNGDYACDLHIEIAKQALKGAVK